MECKDAKDAKKKDEFSGALWGLARNRGLKFG